MKITKPKIIWSLLGITALVSIYLIVIISFWLISHDKIYPGVSVAGISLSGKTRVDAEKLLKEKTDEWSKRYIVLSTENEIQALPSELNVQFDYNNTIDRAVSIGAKNPFLLGFKRNIDISFTLGAEETEKKIDEAAMKITTPVVNSRTEKRENEIVVVNGTNGMRVNYAQSAQNIKEAIGCLENIALVSVFSVPPTFTDKDLSEKMPEISEKSKEPLTLLDGQNKYQVNTETIVSWVDLAQPKRVFAKNMEGDEFYAPIFADKRNNSLFSQSLVSGYLLELSGKINQLPINAELSIEGERASIFVPSRDGRTLNVEKSAKDIITALDAVAKEAKLVVDITKPEIHEGSLNALGIIELLSTGYSNFAGSPTNRRHNIRTGAFKFNGVLIKPNEEFSFNTALGPVDAHTGYLPELVIKEDKTIPEYGGGMCQVSSTTFRAALNAGLPILARTPHSYPVTYYKPYGVDATVYLPKPDLVFQNDTGKYILIQTRIVGNNLYFDFYGTKPKRTITFAGNDKASEAVFPVEKVIPYLYDHGVRGNNSFTAVVYRFIYDSTGNLVKTNKFVSKYDSPDKYPH